MTKITVSMQDFLRTGEFGPVRLGMLRGQIRSLLGEPEDWGPSPRAKHNVGIWKYGDIEFHFNEDVLWLLFADDIGTLDGGKAIDFDPWVLSGAASAESVLVDLEAAGISCQRIPWSFDDGTERYHVGAGIELLFLDESQHLFCTEGASPNAKPGMTFDSFSYRDRKTKG